jgi:hypothetical protein
MEYREAWRRGSVTGIELIEAGYRLESTAMAYRLTETAELMDFETKDVKCSQLTCTPYFLRSSSRNTPAMRKMSSRTM